MKIRKKLPTMARERKNAEIREVHRYEQGQNFNEYNRHGNAARWNLDTAKTAKKRDRALARTAAGNTATAGRRKRRTFKVQKLKIPKLKLR